MQKQARYFLFILIIGLFTACTSRKPAVLGSKGGKQNQSTTSFKKGSIPASANSYIEQYKKIAISEMNRYGIPASVKLAQALLESGSGKSYLAVEANNHFGIKCGGVWNGKSVTRSDDRPDDCFRVYSSAEESFKDHSQFLLRKRYEKLFALRKDDYKGWAKGLKEAGYATNPRYPELLIDLIERYELHQFDRAETYTQQEQRTEIVEEIIIEKKTDQKEVAADKLKAPVAMTIYEVKASDTLYSISKRYNVTVEEIKSWNSLATENLSIGQLLVVTK